MTNRLTVVGATVLAFLSLAATSRITVVSN